ncbi:MAG TPA: hypothetical protein VK717_02560 [Opitutaceae bacterium]|jgi:hypothetical protein|nr:hypothetical protein [Opitutaceae bacterium]
MAHVSVHYKIYLTAGHHRQPRNASAELEPNPSSEVDVTNPGNITPLFIPQLPFTFNGNTGLAQLMFWSVTDGTNGQVLPAGPLTQAVGANPLTITAWYMPVGGPGGPGSPAIIDDAFSAAKGDFIDDTFVTVTSDPSLTSQANVVGIVPTTVAETLQAAASVASTTEPFSKWMAFGAGTASGNTLNVPANSIGIAIAIYQRSSVVLNPPNAGGTVFGTIFGGVAVDGGGWIVINGIPHPVDPWGPLISRLLQSSAAASAAKTMEPKIGQQVRQLAAQDAIIAIKQITTVVERQVTGG